MKRFLLLTSAVLATAPWFGFESVQAFPSGDCIEDDQAEVWLTGQTDNLLQIVRGPNCIETISHPDLNQPHSLEFGPGGDYAYASNIGNGSVTIVRAEDRQVVQTLSFGGTVHHSKTSFDGSTLLVANNGLRTLFRVNANEASETWVSTDSLTGLIDADGIVRNPICVAFRGDGKRAYVSLGPTGDIAIVDLSGPRMAQVGSIDTDGGVQCGLVHSKDGKTIFVDSSGNGGHFYRLDTSSDALIEDLAFAGNINAALLTDFDVSPNEKLAFAADNGSENLKILDLTTGEVETISLSVKPDQVAVQGSNVYVTSRSAGALIWVKSQQGTVSFIDLGLTPGAAPHGNGIAVRPF